MHILGSSPALEKRGEGGVRELRNSKVHNIFRMASFFNFQKDFHFIEKDLVELTSDNNPKV